MAELKYKRILLKLSGEIFCKPGGFGIEGEPLDSIAERIAKICKLGPEVAVVVGGGNFLRGEAFSKKSNIPRNTADYMGMLATIINACALQETLEKKGSPQGCSARSKFRRYANRSSGEGACVTLNRAGSLFWQAGRETRSFRPIPVRHFGRRNLTLS